jgi:hypothetical protein
MYVGADSAVLEEVVILWEDTAVQNDLSICSENILILWSAENLESGSIRRLQMSR